MSTVRGVRALALVPLVALTVAACGDDGDSAPESTPEGAVVLVENQPGTVDGTSVVATDVEGDDATLRITVDGPSEATDVSEGATVDIAGASYRVEAVWSEEDGDSPGSMGGHVMVVPADG
ncbi:hypothetical protein ACQBJO_10235 [Janibacter sp. G349]|uniref:hypothetical protein n=1 Tax=unclassified Janibacter TaxID=2649294 RepID=UPI003B7B80B0